MTRRLKIKIFSLQIHTQHYYSHNFNETLHQSHQQLEKNNKEEIQ